MAYEEPEAIRMVRKSRDKFYRETTGLDAESVLKYIKQGADKYRKWSEKYLSSQSADKRNFAARRVLNQKVEVVEPEAVKEVRQWREKIYEDIKDLSPDAKREYFRKGASVMEAKVKASKKGSRKSSRLLSN